MNAVYFQCFIAQTASTALNMLKALQPYYTLLINCAKFYFPISQFPGHLISIDPHINCNKR